MRDFDYCEPTTLEEAISALLECGEDAKILAGGTDILVRMKRRLISPRRLVNIKRIPGLADIRLDGAGLRIGALATIRDVSLSPLVRGHWPVLSEAAKKMASVQVRNLATIGGNICNAAPSADMAPALMSLDAKAVIVGPAGERTVSLEEFFIGPGATVLRPGEILTHFLVPMPRPSTAAVYLKHAIRKAMDIAIVGVAAAVTLDGETPYASGGSRGISDVRVVLGAVAPTPLRARKAEDAIRGAAIPLDDMTLAQAAEAAMSEARPISDVRASAYYRRKLTGVLVRRGVIQAIELARRETIDG